MKVVLDNDDYNNNNSKKKTSLEIDSLRKRVRLISLLRFLWYSFIQ